MTDDIRLQEEEANVFAICLLVPRAALKQEIKNHPIRLSDGDDALREIADKFQVSVTVIVSAISIYRLL